MAYDAVRTSSSVGSSASTTADQARKSSRSSKGTPSSSQITVIGRGNANASIRSTGSPSAPRAAMASSSSSVIASIRGRSASTRREVNALLTSLRSRVWSGGSELSMCARSASANTISSPSCSGSMYWSSTRPFFSSRGSASAALASSYLVTIQVSQPWGSTTLRAGPSSRSAACTASGSWK